MKGAKNRVPTISAGNERPFHRNPRRIRPECHCSDRELQNCAWQEDSPYQDFAASLIRLQMLRSSMTLSLRLPIEATFEGCRREVEIQSPMKRSDEWFYSRWSNEDI